MATWRPIKDALNDPKVTGEQQTIFVARLGQEKYPSYNCVYYDHLQAGAGNHVWQFADGGGAYHQDWPTHFIFADTAAMMPSDLVMIDDDE